MLGDGLNEDPVEIAVAYKGLSQVRFSDDEIDSYQKMAKRDFTKQHERTGVVRLPRVPPTVGGGALGNAASALRIARSRAADARMRALRDRVEVYLVGVNPQIHVQRAKTKDGALWILSEKISSGGASWMYQVVAEIPSDCMISGLYTECECKSLVRRVDEKGQELPDDQVVRGIDEVVRQFFSEKESGEFVGSPSP